MRQRRTIGLVFAMILMLVGCQSHKEYDAFGDRELVVFDTVNVAFHPGINKEGIKPDSEGMIRLVDGRIILKRISVPNFRRTTKVTAKISLSSHGDRWDKSGSCFVIPKNTKINFMEIQKGLQKFPAAGDEVEGLPGIIAGENYQPVVELMRFMTPFGVGYYNDKMELRRPPYIPVWAEEVYWEQDITDLLSELEGEVWVGVWIDTWTAEGYTFSLKLDFDESHLACDKKQNTQVKSLVNTVYYIGPQKHADIFARKDLVVKAEIPDNAMNVRLKYITTGHGGHSGGDEFVKKENIIFVDGQKVHSFIPWRDDCASFRRFNPGTGVWFAGEREGEYIDWEKEGYQTTTVKERVGSSDFSRSNWCPGSDVLPVEIALPNISSGTHEFKFSIPKAQPIMGDKMNHWLVSAYLVWDTE